MYLVLKSSTTILIILHIGIKIHVSHKGPFDNLDIWIFWIDIDQGNDNYVWKLRYDFLGTKFNIYDEPHAYLFCEILLKQHITYPLCVVNMITTPLEAISEIKKSWSASGGLWLEGAFPGGSQRDGSTGVAIHDHIMVGGYFRVDSHDQIMEDGSQGLLASFDLFMEYGKC